MTLQEARAYLARPEVQAELQRLIDETAEPLPPMTTPRSLVLELWVAMRRVLRRVANRLDSP